MCDYKQLCISVCMHSSYLVMLVELAAEGNSEVSCSSTGNCVGGVQRLATVIRAPALADLHILEARLDTGKFFRDNIGKHFL